MEAQSIELINWIDDGKEWEMPDSMIIPEKYIDEISHAIKANSHFAGGFQLMLDDDYNAYAMVLNQGNDDFHSIDTYEAKYGCTICMYWMPEVKKWDML